jgi:hypothetical protein
VARRQNRRSASSNSAHIVIAGTERNGKGRLVARRARLTPAEIRVLKMEDERIERERREGMLFI